MKLRIFRLSFLIIGLAFSLLTTLSKSVYGDISIGVYYGYSFILEEKPYDEHVRDYGKEYKTMDTKDKYGLYVQYFPGNKRFGFYIDGFGLNRYTVVHRALADPINAEKLSRSKGGLTGVVLGLKFRFFGDESTIFGDKGTRFNPYVTLGYVFLSEPRGGFLTERSPISSEPICPSRNDIEVGGGIKYRITNRYLINLGLSYFPKNSFSSIRAGLEISL